MTDNDLYDINRQVGETLIMVGAIKEGMDEHKKVHEDILKILHKHENQISFVKGAMWVLGGVVAFLGYILKALAH